MIYCLISESTLLKRDNIEIKYSLINDCDELKVNKHFKIDFNKDNVVYARFSQSQFLNNSFDNLIHEISNDFSRSKYIFGKNDFEKYFFQIDELMKVNENFRCKYMKVDDILKKVSLLHGVI